MDENYFITPSLRSDSRRRNYGQPLCFCWDEGYWYNVLFDGEDIWQTNDSGSTSNAKEDI